MELDFTKLCLLLFNGAIGTLITVGTIWLKSHMENKQAAAVLGNALTNSLGAVQAAADGFISKKSPSVVMIGLPEPIRIALQYTLDNAGSEAAKLGLTQEALVAKINARIGLAKIESSTVFTDVVTANAKKE